MPMRDQIETVVIMWLRRIFLAFLAVITAGPLLYLLLLSVRPLTDVVRAPLDVIPSLSELTVDTYRRAVVPPEDGGFGMASFMWHSLLVAGATVAVALVFSVLGAYAAARLDFFGKRTVSVLIFVIYLFPAVVMAIPLFVIFSRLALRGSLAALVIVYVAHTVPVALYMLRNYFEAVPASLEEAAKVDGAGRLRVIWRIVLPLSLPALVATGLYVFMIAWNEFLFALLFLAEFREKWTVSLGVALLDDQNIAQTVLMAASVLLTVPIVVVFFVAERMIVSGLTAGADKG
jgi:multiple sugar transport system permease protein